MSSPLGERRRDGSWRHSTELGEGPQSADAVSVQRRVRELHAMTDQRVRMIRELVRSQAAVWRLLPDAARASAHQDIDTRRYCHSDGIWPVSHGAGGYRVAVRLSDGELVEFSDPSRRYEASNASERNVLCNLRPSDLDSHMLLRRFTLDHLNYRTREGYANWE